MQPADPVATKAAVEPLHSVFGVVGAIFFSPRAWFSDLPEGTVTALVVALLVNLGSTLVWRAITFGLRPALTSHYQRVATETEAVVWLPALGIYTLARFTKKRESLGKIVRCLSYAQVPMVLSVVPVVGHIAGELWSIGLTVFGLRWALQRPWAFVLGSLLGTFGCVCFLLVLAWKFLQP